MGVSRQTEQQSPPRLKPVPSFCVCTFVWCCHTESPANSLAVTQVSCHLTAVSGPLTTSSGVGAR